MDSKVVNFKEENGYERLSFSFHRYFWFDLNAIDMALFRQELLTVMRASTMKHENGR